MKLQSVLKNVPHYLRVEIMKYKTKPCAHKIRWVAREPVAGKKYGWGGSLKLEDSKSADLYVDKKQFDLGLVQKAHELQVENSELRADWVSAQNEIDSLKHKAIQMQGVIVYLERNLEKVRKHNRGLIR